MTYIKISRNVGKVPVTDGHGWCHYRVVIKSLCQRLCPLIPSYYDVASNFRSSFYRAMFFPIQMSVILIITGTCVSRKIFPHLRARRFEATVVL
jgi:hypothetical protein